MAVRMDGLARAAAIKERIHEEVESLLSAGLRRRPRLDVILVGENPASQIYVRGKERDCRECGFEQNTIRLSADTPQAALLAVIRELNQDPSVDAILLQLPVEGHDEREAIREIAPEKDVDCLHPLNMGRLAEGNPLFLPCTPSGIMELLRAYNIPIRGKNCVVLGRSSIVGKPMASLLAQADGTVTLCHSKTENLPEHTRRADILVSAAGRLGLVTGDMVKEGAVVIDVSMNRNMDGKLCGDVDFAAVEPKASFITPVPGGVGPMTRAMLMVNVLEAAKRNLESGWERKPAPDSFTG